MRRIDGYDTPPSLAAVMVGAVREGRRLRTVLDPAMGTGNLLRAASERWGGELRYFGCDNAASVVDCTRVSNPAWVVGYCDFLNPRSRASCRVIRGLPVEGVDLVLINPPFSGRGSASRVLSVGDRSIRCSPALAFVGQSMRYLSNQGLISALLPAGTIVSEKDAEAWRAIQELAAVALVRKFDRGAFLGASARTVLVTISHGKPRPGNQLLEEARTPTGDVVVVSRGNVRMHEVGEFESSKGVPLIHTTGLSEHQIKGYGPMVNGLARQISGPAVLLPRVGLPRLDKVVFVSKGTTVAPSDCILAIQGSEKASRRVEQALVTEWSSLVEFYGGSCAPYITIRRLLVWLMGRGIHARELAKSRSEVKEKN